ncbi:MAG: radical SAM protein, partial [Myxococcota bacterium]
MTLTECDTLSMMHTIGLVLCPYFGFGTPPLGLAALQAALQQAGHPTRCFDLDFMMLSAQPETISRLFHAYYIGHAEGIDQVQFILRPTLTMMALFPDAYGSEQTAPFAEDLQVIRQVERFLQSWVDPILQQGVQVVMASVYVSNLLPTLLLARALKQVDPTLRFVVGGPGVAAHEIQDFLLRLGMVDVCATGEGEQVAPALAGCFAAGRRPHVPGAAYLHDGEVVRLPPPPLLPLNRLPTPNFASLPIPGWHVQHYRSNPNASTRWFGVALPISTTRGCVMRCTFCSETNYWTRFRQRDPQAVVDEIKELAARWGVHQFTFGDSLLNGNPKWLERFADLCIAQQLPVTFVFAYFRPAKLPGPLLKKLFQAGFRLMAFGLETASQPLLDRLAKGTRVAEAEQIVLDALDAGIHVNLSILCGVPTETPARVMDSIRFITRLRARAIARSGPPADAGLTVHAGWPLRVEPDSRMYHQPERAGIAMEPIPPNLPETLQHLTVALQPLMLRWSSEIPLEEIQIRADLLQKTINREPMTLFATGDLTAWIAPETAFGPVSPAAILSDGQGNRYLVSNGQIRAQMNPVAADAWPMILQGATVQEMVDQLSAPEAALRDVLAQLLQNRLIYVDDFRFVRQRAAARSSTSLLLPPLIDGSISSI